jgi:hypothetical protein
MPSVEHDTSSQSPSWNNQFPWMQAHIRCLEILNKSVKNQANGKVGKVEQ